MDRKTFWNIIDESRKNVDDVFDLAPEITERLQTLDPDEIISFAQNLSDLLAESYRYDLWAAGYIVNGGCSDDGFEYFCGWLIAQGRERFQAALENPAAIGDWAEEDENECEDLLYAAMGAYQEKTGNEFPQNSITTNYPSEPIGEKWNEDQLEELFPDLYKKFF